MSVFRLVLIALLIMSIACNESKRNYVEEVLSIEGNHLVRNVRYDTGQIARVTKYYTLDTFPHGAELFYYRNNNVERWKWFIKGQRYLQYAVYYDTNNNFQYQKGLPFFGAVNLGNDTLAIEIANPPRLNYLFSYKEFAGKRLLRLLLKEPVKTDSTSWVTVPNHKFEDGHNYFACFYILDNNQRMIDSVCQELSP